MDVWTSLAWERRERGLRLRVAVRIERTPGESLFWTTGAVAKGAATIRTVHVLACCFLGSAGCWEGQPQAFLTKATPAATKKRSNPLCPCTLSLVSRPRCLLHHPANPCPGRGGWGHPERGPGAGLAGGRGAVVSAQMHRGAGSRGGTLAEVGRARGVF